jgi:predicted small secreted protein
MNTGAGEDVCVAGHAVYYCIFVLRAVLLAADSRVE